MLTRRKALLGLSAAFTLGGVSMALGAAPTQNRFIVILLRGAMDGLYAVQPYGDANLIGARGELALPLPGQDGGVLDLGGFYGLHPSMPNLHAMYAAGDALILHAAAGHYRSRSHFEAQDYLECGVDQRLDSGWLNRAVATMQGAGRADLALSMGLSAPLILRGPARIEAWAPPGYGQDPSDDLFARLQLLADRDPMIGPALQAGYRLHASSIRTATASAAQASASIAAIAGQPGVPKPHPEVVLAGAAGQMLAAPTGPRVAVLEIGGWDTHAAQAGRLKVQLGVLDEALSALHAGLGPAWRQTAILAVTEFGRTARINGTKGTDHGTGSVAFLVGGAVSGGKVRANWPGLGAGQLFEDRDLMPTTDVRSVAKGVLASHLGLGGFALDQAFPGSGDAPPLAGLIRA